MNMPKSVGSRTNNATIQASALYAVVNGAAPSLAHQRSCRSCKRATRCCASGAFVGFTPPVLASFHSLRLFIFALYPAL